MGELLKALNTYYLQNEQKLIEKYKGQYIAMHDGRVAESFGSERDAYVYCVKHFQIGTFLIREVT